MRGDAEWNKIRWEYDPTTESEDVGGYPVSDTFEEAVKDMFEQIHIVTEMFRKGKPLRDYQRQRSKSDKRKLIAKYHQISNNMCLDSEDLIYMSNMLDEITDL